MPRLAASRRQSRNVPARSRNSRQESSGHLAPELPKAETFANPELRAEAESLASTEISYVDHPEFHGRTAAKWLEAQRPDMTPTEGRRASATIGLAFVSGLVQAPLLSHPQERYLFLKMNFLKFRAERLRRKIKVQNPNPALIGQIQATLAESMEVRNQIAEANLRLVVAVAKKLSNSLDQLSELTSEGLLPLMRAVELFNVHLGNRFSTYATWAVRNQMHRALKRSRGAAELASSEDDAGWEGIADRRPSATAEIQAQEHQQQFLTELIDSLNDRERRVISARFGLDGEPTGQSLSDISVHIGLSKERVRQIVLQAVDKLRQAAHDASIEPPEYWCCVED